MGRSAEGWKLKPPDKRTGIRAVRFRHDGKRYDRSTGERDLAKARVEAAKIYAGVVTGKDKTRVADAPKRSLADLMAAFLADIDGEITANTLKNYEYVLFGSVEPHFRKLTAFNPPAIADYYRVRLRAVLKQSVRFEVTVIRRFLAWSVERSLMAAVPTFPPLPKSAMGTRAVERKEKPVHITEDDARDILGALPERSRYGIPVRARFILQWETSLRQATIARLRVPEHYRKGSPTLTITDPIDKARFGRVLPLTDAARAALDGVCPDEGVIFGAKRVDTFRRYLVRAANAAGLSAELAKAFSAYDLRHGRITHLLSAGAPLPAVAFLAGHTLLTTTNTYVQVAEAAAIARDALRVVGGITGGKEEETSERRSKK